MRSKKPKLRPLVEKPARGNRWLEVLSRCAGRTGEYGNIHQFAPAIEYRARMIFRRDPERWIGRGMDFEDIAQGISLALVPWDNAPILSFVARLKGIDPKTRYHEYGGIIPCPLAERLEILEVIARFGEVSPIVASILIAKLESIDNASLASHLRAKREGERLAPQTLAKVYNWVGDCLFDSLPLRRKVAFVFDSEEREATREWKPKTILSGLMFEMV